MNQTPSEYRRETAMHLFNRTADQPLPYTLGH
jgi:hypothetical protein